MVTRCASARYPGESAGGVSPPPLSGPDVTVSRHPAPTVPAGGDGSELPVGEQVGLVLVHRPQPLNRPQELAAKSSELVHRPSGQVLVDAPCEEVQLGAVEASVEGRRLARWR